MTHQAPPRIIEKRRLALARQRARARLNSILGADFLLRQIADDLSLRLGVINRPFHKALLIAPAYPGFVTAIGNSVNGNVRQLSENQIHDERLAIEDGGFDLIVSIGQLHLINDVPGMLTQLKQQLRPDGLLIACVPGGKTLASVRETWMSAEVEMTGGLASRFLPLFDVRTGGSLLQRAGFALPVTDSDEVLVSYRQSKQIFADLRSMAGTNVLADGQRHRLGPAVWREFNRRLDAQRELDDKLRVAYEFVWMSG
ncbi:MAG: methyltransferase domain-containing protein, partial [Pseudomonadota bacterium]